ncbi:NAD(P)-binding protein [Mycena galericulata]|nr:NAD(P)-binding protein [Mycena galericulata]
MTITQDPTAPLVAVVGATGVQGGSVVRALADSHKAYRVRGFTRDGAKPASRELAALGVVVVVISLVVDNQDAVYKAFSGADFAFLMTTFWEHLDADREIAEGKLLIDAAKAAGVAGIVWAGLPSVTKLSGGKYTHVCHFDGKAAVTAYGRQAGVPFADVQAGTYASNFLSPLFAPVKNADGSFVLTFPVKSSKLVPLIDTQHDYGLFVRHVFELPVFPDGGEFLAYGEAITVEQLAEQWSQGTGKKFAPQPISSEAFKEGLKSAGYPPHIVLCISEVFLAWDEFGLYKVTPIPENLGRRLVTWAEYVKDTDWSKVLA